MASSDEWKAALFASVSTIVVFNGFEGHIAEDGEIRLVLNHAHELGKKVHLVIPGYWVVDCLRDAGVSMPTEVTVNSEVTHLPSFVLMRSEMSVRGFVVSNVAGGYLENSEAEKLEEYFKAMRDDSL